MESNIPLSPDAHLSSGEPGTEDQYSVDVDADLRLDDEARKMLFQTMINNAQRATVDMYPENADRIAKGRIPIYHALYELAEPLSVVDEVGDMILADRVYVLAIPNHSFEAFIVRLDQSHYSPEEDGYWDRPWIPKFLTLVLNKTPDEGLEMGSTGIQYAYKGRDPDKFAPCDQPRDGYLPVLAEAMATIATLQSFPYSRQGDINFIVNNVKSIEADK